MSTLILFCRSPDVDAYRALLDRDLLRGRLLVPAGESTPDLHETVLIRVEVAQASLTLEAQVVAPRIKAGDKPMVGVVFPVDDARARALRSLSAAAQPATASNGQTPTGTPAASQPDATGPWPSPAGATREDTAPERDRATPESGIGTVTPTRIRRRPVDDATFIPHHHDSAFGAPPPSASRWPVGLPPLDRLVAARSGQLDPADRAGVLHALDGFATDATRRQPHDVLGLPNDPDEASIHRAFQRLTAALGARDPDPMLSPDLAERLRTVIDALVRNRDIALVYASRPSRRLEPSPRRP